MTLRALCAYVVIFTQVKNLLAILLLLSLFSCQEKEEKIFAKKITKTSLVVLGNVQDAGSPHIACKKECCKALFKNPDPTRKVVSLGLIIPYSKETYLFEATPDMPAQLKMLNALAPFDHKETPDGIFLTHAHIGHYAGLMYLGKEAMDAKEVPILCMPRMKKYLETNGPWSQLVNSYNIKFQQLPDSNVSFLHRKSNGRPAGTFRLHTYLVPHRDEFSETVGYLILASKRILFIPDIDKWEKWETDIIEEIKKVDYAFLDGTFYDGNELPGRDIKQIPHPFVIESMELFKDLSEEDKAKIHFIHFNHTNPLLNKNSKEYKEVIKRGFNIANYGDVFEL